MRRSLDTINSVYRSKCYCIVIRLWCVCLCYAQSSLSSWICGGAHWYIDALVLVSIFLLYNDEHVSLFLYYGTHFIHFFSCSIDASFLCYAIDLDTGTVHLSAAHTAFSGFDQRLDCNQYFYISYIRYLQQHSFTYPLLCLNYLYQTYIKTINILCKSKIS